MAAYIRRLHSRPLFSLIVFGVLSAFMAGCAHHPSRISSGYSSSPPYIIKVSSAKRSDVIMTALGLLNTRYRYGGSEPEEGFDCSGLVAYVFNTAANTQLPRNAAELAKHSRPVSRLELNAGDFVFFNTLGRPFSHVGIYIGDGKFINAPSSGGKVRIDTLNSTYFSKRFEGARTLFRS